MGQWRSAKFLKLQPSSPSPRHSDLPSPMHTVTTREVLVPLLCLGNPKLFGLRTFRFSLLPGQKTAAAVAVGRGASSPDQTDFRNCFALKFKRLPNTSVDHRSQCPASRPLQPALAPEVDERCHHRQRHQGQRIRITQGPIQLGHGFEVHAVNAGDQGGRQQADAGH